MLSKVETATQGRSCANAKPFAAATPMRTPVKEPGPALTATASMLSSGTPAFLQSCSAMGMSVWLCVRPVLMKNSPIILSSSAKQTEAAFAEVSIANTVIVPLLLFEKYAVHRARRAEW